MVVLAFAVGFSVCDGNCLWEVEKQAVLEQNLGEGKRKKRGST